MCGGDLEVEDGATTCKCTYCGTSQTVASVDRAGRNSGGQNGETSILPGAARAMVLRGNLALEDGAFDLADTFYERALDSSPSYGRAYLGKFLAGMKVASLDALSGDIVDFEGNRDFQRAVKFADEELANELLRAMSTNDANIESAKKLAAEEKAAKEERARRFDAAKREAFPVLFRGENTGIADVRSLFDGAEGACPEQFAQMSVDDLLDIVRKTSAVLASRGVYSEAELMSRLDVGEDKGPCVGSILNELVQYGLVEATSMQDGIVYGLPGASAEIEERRKAEALRRLAFELAERKYDEACASAEDEIQAEMRPLAKEIESRYAPSIAAAKRDMGDAESAAMRERVRLQMELSRLKTRRAALGLFDKQRKSQIDEEIAQINLQLDTIASPEHVRTCFEPRIDEIVSRRDAELSGIEAEVRARHPLPVKDVFVAEAMRDSQTR